MEDIFLEKLEQEIEQQQRNVSFDTKEYTIEIIVQKYLKDLDKEQNEFFVPEYQREFVWDTIRQSRFIESLMIGLPILYIFLAETSKGRYEIVDGSQRIRTLAAYLNDELVIKGLEKIEDLNKLKFSDLDISRQRKFKNISLNLREQLMKLKMIYLRELIEVVIYLKIWNIEKAFILEDLMIFYIS